MDPRTQDIPIITITADQFAPLGITLGDQPAAGGADCAPVGEITIPFLDLKHFDERSGCGLAHEYLNAHAYVAGRPTTRPICRPTGPAPVTAATCVAAPAGTTPASSANQLRVRAGHRCVAGGCCHPAAAATPRTTLSCSLMNASGRQPARPASVTTRKKITAPAALAKSKAACAPATRPTVRMRNSALS